MDNNKVKEQYNKQIKENQRYEEKRWFSSPVRKSGYAMTKDAVWRRALAESYNTCLELGPGHGTWTKELLRFSSLSEYDLVDISSEMLNLAKKRFAGRGNIRFFESDWLDFSPDKKYDFFFSARAFEYIGDKEKAVEKILDALRAHGRGVVITKTPKYLRNKILGRKSKDFHSGQIKPKELKRLLEKHKACHIQIYPVIMIFPVLQSARLNMMLYKIFSRFELNFFSRQFSESYLIKFTKKA